MKKSRSIRLTVVAALGLAARAQQGAQAPAAAAGPQSCEERRNAAQVAGATFNENCGHSASAHSVAHRGFGATGEAHSAGG